MKNIYLFLKNYITNMFKTSKKLDHFSYLAYKRMLNRTEYLMKFDHLNDDEIKKILKPYSIPFSAIVMIRNELYYEFFSIVNSKIGIKV